ncbi:ribosome silencing factor [Curvibacter sp. CHRR-16]|uniref:ribosome silencing factor n=1 Tax=Curvibacter sp. CHRR-16 TaxID=2835872 RepID=UPI001BDA4779|nr:ribosome silencing factor [Curvibacter sp. CHRR-16]MBT0569353.1 ribosome silencing factor [Curvibacter sp. CHRR-16]
MSTTNAKKDVQKLQRAIVDGLEDVKAQDIVVFDTENLSPLFERVIIASGTSNRQTKALAQSVIDSVKEAGFSKPRVEGEANGEWIIVDCTQAVVHIMQPTFRQYYHLEELWGEKPVRIKLGAAKPVASEAALAAKAEKKASADKAAKAATGAGGLKRSTAAKTAANAPKKAPAKAPAKKAAGKAPAKKVAAKKVASKKPAAPVQKLVVNKPVAKKAAPAKKATAPKVAASAKPAAKKVAAKKAVVKAPAKSSSRKA